MWYGHEGLYASQFTVIAKSLDLAPTQILATYY